MVEQVNNGISEALYAVSSALLLPVLLAVVALLAVTLAGVGGVVREAVDRRRGGRAVRQALGIAEAGGPASAVWDALAMAPSGLGRRLAKIGPAADERALGRALAALDADVAAALGRAAFVARVGPMLGLLGTLIPFGPALAGLSAGDVQALSANLVTAFATTVVGLLCGSLGYVIGNRRRAWYRRDMDDLEHLCDLLCAGRPAEGERHAETETDAAAAAGPGVGGNGRRPDRRVGQLV